MNSDTGSASGACHGFYDRAENGLYLFSDDLGTLQGPVAPGTSGSLQNSQCTLRGDLSQAVTVGATDLTLRLGLSLRSTFAAAARNVYLWVRDNEGNDTGGLQTTIWTSGGGAAVPSVVSATPAIARVLPQTFSVLVRDLDGSADIQRIYFLANSTNAVTANSCHGFYDQAANQFTFRTTH